MNHLCPVMRVAVARRHRGRGVGAHVGAALLLGHAHAERDAVLLPPRNEARVIGARGDLADQPLQHRRLDRERPDAGARHGDRAHVAVLDLRHHEVARRARDLGGRAARDPSAVQVEACRPSRKLSAMKRVIGRDEIRPRRGGSPWCRKSCSFGVFSLASARRIEHRGRAPAPPELRQRRRLPARTVGRHRIAQRPVAREQVDVLVGRGLVDDVVGFECGAGPSSRSPGGRNSTTHRGAAMHLWTGRFPALPRPSDSAYRGRFNEHRREEHVRPHTRHLLGIEGLSPDDITGLLDLAEEFVELNRQIEKKRTSLRGRTLINLFFEASTRTQSSFELAGKRLGADVMNMAVGNSSREEGRDADRHRDDAQRHAPRHPGGAASCLRRGRAAGAEGRRLGGQCGRRRARAPDPGAARCARRSAATRAASTASP